MSIKKPKANVCPEPFTLDAARKRARIALSAAAIAVLGSLGIGCARAPVVRFERGQAPLTVRRPALYPETIAYDALRDRFLLSSFREGAIFQVDLRGNATSLVDDPRLCSVLGIALDAARGRLWAVNADLGASSKPSKAGAKRLAAVGMYDLGTGKAMQYVDLAPLSPGPRLLNGIALDSAGNAYVTDSFSSAIYRVDAEGQAKVLLQDAHFAGEGITLNGVVVHPDGYLLLIKKSDGALFKVPLSAPTHFSKVELREQLVGGDGVTLIGKGALLVIANQTPGRASNAAYALSSEDGWVSAKLRAVQELGNVYPTTAVLRRGRIYALHSQLNQLIQAPAEQKAQLRMEATIESIGTVFE
jgi:sugar lactone lactonase YvrE